VDGHFDWAKEGRVSHKKITSRQQQFRERIGGVCGKIRNKRIGSKADHG
jgi:hypothetical protein